jgi:hypothetical protein
MKEHGVFHPYGMADLRDNFNKGFVTFPLHQRSSPTVAYATMCRDLPVDRPDYDELEILDKGSSTMRESFHSAVKAAWPQDLNLSPAEQLAHCSKAFAQVGNLLQDVPDPTKYKDAVADSHPYCHEWRAAVKKELNNLIARGTWSCVKRSTLARNKYPVRCKWVFRKKLNKDGSPKYKARLVACGYSQRPGTDYSSDELYASVCSYSSMRFLMSLATQKNLMLYQTDITQAYLEAELNEDIYMDMPKGMEYSDSPANAKDVLKLHRSLYGLKQAGFAWSQCFRDFMTSPEYNMGFTSMTGEPNLYRRKFILDGTSEEIIIGQYVDDCLLAVSSQKVLDWFLDNIKNRFTVNADSSGFITTASPGLLLSMHVRYDQKAGILQFDQKSAIEALAKKFGHDKVRTANCARSLPFPSSVHLEKLDTPGDPKDCSEFLSIVGSCLHLAQVSRPDISFAVGVLCRHAATPGKQHMKAAHDLIKYLYHSREWCIQYTRTTSPTANSPCIIERSYFPEYKKERKLFLKKQKKANAAAAAALAAAPATESQPTVTKTGPSTKSIEQRIQDGLPDNDANDPVTYIDADLGGDRYTRKSTSGLLIMMNGGPVSWSSRLQKLCAQSSAEAEINAVVDGVKEALHIRLLCEECDLREPGIPMEVWEDNQACIQMGHNLRGSNSAKHYELRLRFLNEQIWENNIQFSKIHTSKQLSDGFTKPLNLTSFRDFRSSLMHNCASNSSL